MRNFDVHNQQSLAKQINDIDSETFRMDNFCNV